ncbi:vacuolar protein sorting-associated protein 35 [Protomyces lactucae-debilis]|uniref:Vacuolar protein sorting-associated protein 35 n=1 Tax=Protomyces lactucae-debilis TaxID=2754530 RepID=A0A1Y2FVJ4_PROLT|nr:vacuolar protein sorting-associated protein 35 [Protomyces lactucae-debilis]ORY87979.1 vacuolar protein sorting-associated protein 35 [Protomyces lactucae-debilis]
MSAEVAPEDAHSLEEALTTVRVSKTRMVQCLDNVKLMDGLKHASTMLSELRTSSLGPKQYYELYMSVFDALGYLTNYLKEAHTSGRHHLADLYELVQYAGNIVPRLYLMITVGGVYMGMLGAPVKEITKDMMEMSRGVQHPIRGLFLRHYLSGQTRDHMPIGTDDGPQGNLQDSIQFTITNFIEMNKLWVRLQHQGHSRERHLRELERTELKTLVGTNLVRLSQLEGIDLALYSEVILPAVLEQVVQCRDVLAQEYLLEVVTQVYPDEYHLRTLDQFLSAVGKLNPHANVKQVVIQMIDRLASFAASETENEPADERARKEEQAARALSKRLAGTKVTDEQPVEAADTPTEAEGEASASSKTTKEQSTETYRGIPVDIRLFEIFWNQIVSLVQSRQELKIQDVSAMLVSLCNLALSCYPTQLDYIDQILSYAEQKTKEHVDSTDLHSTDARDNLMKLLQAPIQTYSSLMTVLAIPSFVPLLHAQSYAIRRSVAATVAKILLSKRVAIESVEEAEGTFDLLKVLICEAGPPVQVANGSAQPRRTRDAESDESIEEQGWLARIVHLLRGPTLDVDFKLLQIARRQLQEGGDKIKYTFPPVVVAALRLARKWKAREHIDDGWSEQNGLVFKFIHQTTLTLYQCVGCAEQAMRLFLFAGQVADQAGSEEVAYEFFAQAFTIYEEAISESKAQYQAVAMVVSALQQTRNFTQDNYDTLITKCALHGAKLLKKPDQTRAILAASHLWWQTDAPGRGEEDVATLFRDGKRVLECLQKALKIADACMDTATSIQLFIEILDRYLYYFDHGNDAILPKFINGLIDLIRQNLENMEQVEGGRGAIVTSTSALTDHEGKLHEFIVAHFERTLEHIRTRKEQDEEEHWQEVLA